jgi:hypothetical protein
MKRSLFVLLVFIVLSCKGKPSLSDDDKAYIRTTIDLMRTRANFGPNTDSLHVLQSLDSVYKRHHTSRGAYIQESASLADDPKHAELVLTTINDSVGSK